MRFVFASYVYTESFKDPEAWISRLSAYTGILRNLARKNEVISIEQINFEGKHTSNKVNYHFKRYPKNILRFFPIKQNWFIKRLYPDVVVIQGLHFPLQVILLRLLLGKKVKILAQNRAEKPFRGYKKVLQQIADKCINAYLFGSREMGLDWVKAGNLSSEKKIHEVMGLSSIFYPIDKRLARTYTGVSGSPSFLWVGRLNANKDPLTVVEAFLKFTEKKYPSAMLYMIYQTCELLPEIKILLESHSNGKNVVLVGDVPHPELLYWFNSASYLISGSHYEGGGTAICEAMSCGCIPVITAIQSFKMITNNGACGILYEPGNQKALLAALHNIVSANPAEKQALCLDHFTSQLSFEAITAKVQEIMADL